MSKPEIKSETKIMFRRDRVEEGAEENEELLPKCPLMFQFEKEFIVLQNINRGENRNEIATLYLTRSLS